MPQIIIDVREPSEYAAGHVPGAINIPVDDINANTMALKDLEKNSIVIVYCKSGGRAGAAKASLEQLGFSDVTNGINAENVVKMHIR